MRSLARFAAIVLCVLSLAAPPAAAQQLRLTLDDIEHPAFSAHDIDLRWSGGRASLSIARLRLAGRDLGRVALRCATAVWQRGGFECRGGMLRLGSGETLPLSLVYDAAAGSLELAFADAPLAAVARLVPELAAWKLAGRLDGTLRLAAGRAEARCAIRQASFSDAAGMRAGEALAASASLAGQLDPSGGWRWEARLDWSGGEVYWAPVYLKAEQQALSAAGTYADGIITVTAGEAQLGGLGRAAFTLAWSAATRQLSAARLDVDGIDLARAVPALLQPTLDERALPRLAARGRARLALTLAGDGVSEIDLDLDDVDLAEDDASPRFAINGLTARIPWRRDAETEAELHAAGGSLGRLPLGTIALAPRLNGFALTLAKAEIPLLDGRLILEDVEARRLGADWQWRLSGALEPVSMRRVAAVLGLPPMNGVLSVAIPRLDYANGVAALHGSLVIAAFDGYLSATGLRVVDPLGRAPRLLAEVELRHLDLGQLTETFSFGGITGYIDGDVRGLELVAWKPQRFDAAFRSSPGDYRKRISQRAVQDISALGGAGAGAAIERTFLGFFDSFGYERLGLSCKLADGVCEMGGIETASRGYLIVKGGGVPALNVMGYNRQVHWDELLGRLQAAIRSHGGAVIR